MSAYDALMDKCTDLRLRIRRCAETFPNCTDCDSPGVKCVRTLLTMAYVDDTLLSLNNTIRELDYKANFYRVSADQNDKDREREIDALKRELAAVKAAQGSAKGAARVVSKRGQDGAPHLACRCGGVFPSATYTTESGADLTINMAGAFKFCPYCGRRLIWEVAE